MPSSAASALPAGIRHESLQVGAAPVVRHFLEMLDLLGLFDRHLPPWRGRRRDVPTATVLCVLLGNLLLARQPLYGMAAWACEFVPEHLGLLPEQLARLNDDRFGRALDHLYRADRASLLTAVALHTMASLNSPSRSYTRTQPPSPFRESMTTSLPPSRPTALPASPLATTRTTAPISNNCCTTAR
jgi:Domain of unknown function (DUF4277)